MENIVEIARNFAFKAHESINQLYDGQPYSVHLEMAAMNGLIFNYLLPPDFSIIFIVSTSKPFLFHSAI